MTIDTIRIWDSSGGEQQTELYVNLTSYNSDTEVTTTILNNQTLVYFDAATNTTTFFPIINHTGFCIPKTNIDGCVEGIEDFLDSVYDFEVTLHLQQGNEMGIGAGDTDTNLVYAWAFRINNPVVYEFVVAYSSTPNNYEYRLLLKSGGSVSLGNFFIVFLGIGVISLIYLSKKKIKQN